MRPDEAKTVAAFLLDTLESEIPLTTAVLQAVPDDGLAYRPDDKSKTALGLLRHITLEDEWILSGVADGRLGPVPDDSDACGVMKPAQAVARYKERIPAVMARVRALPGEALVAEVDFLGAFQLPAINLLSLMVRHSVHHRGQMSAYLRAMGGKVPGIYGPSADTVTAASA
jgi:uncharacterized damage-inducible protein DinB